MLNTVSQLESNPENIWKNICEQLQKKLQPRCFLTWFNPIEAISFEDNLLKLRVPSRFYCDWIEAHYSENLRNAVSAAFGDDLRLKYVIDKKGSKRKQPYSEEIVEEKSSIVSRKRVASFKTNLNPHYTFNNFIEGDCNRFARAAATSIANNPGNSTFNPHLIYGGSGLGKTHLIQGIGNCITKEKPHLRVLYVTGEQFTIDFVKSLKESQIDSFNHLYRTVDVLLLDDVQFFMAKERTQEEFFHTFNALHQAGKQLVFSSDRPPRELKEFDERLISRLQWGLISEVHIPDYETRLAILKDLMEQNKFEFPDNVVQFLAINVTDNVRTLHGIFTHLLAQTSFIGEKITLDLAKKVVSNFVSKPQHQLSIHRIQEIIAEEMDVPCDLIRSKTRKKEIVQARQIAMFFCTEFTSQTLKTIGLQFGGRDHTTVIYAREKIQELMNAQKRFSETMSEMRQLIELASV